MKAFNEAILQNIYSWGSMVSYENFLQKFEKALLENLICSYGISFSWKIFLCSNEILSKISWKTVFVMIVFSPGKFDVYKTNIFDTYFSVTFEEMKQI